MGLPARCMVVLAGSENIKFTTHTRANLNMSIPTDPDLYSYADPAVECQRCFDPDKSPAQLFLSISGIKIGGGWLPAFPPPPSGLYELTAVAPCSWFLNDGSWTYSVVYTAAKTECLVEIPLGLISFWQSQAPTCQSTLSNSYVDPVADIYYGGFVHFVPPLLGTVNSIQHVMSLVSPDPKWAKYDNPQVVDANTVVHKFYRRTGKTNVKIRYHP